MATATTVHNKPEVLDQAELDRLAQDFFNLAEEQLATMDSEKRESVIASIHTTAESLRAKR